VIAILIILGALLFAAGTTTGSSDSVSAGSPALTLEPGSKLVVRGSHFREGERVTITVFTGERPHAVQARAVRGSFRVRLNVPANGCAAPRFVRARGDQGSVATVAVAKPGICVPPPAR
jgi:hypothetical protein